jgi:DNA-directed RNA polymerase subunit RPC12/RpoP
MSHRDDDGVECDCQEQEGEVVGSDDEGDDIVECPECESREITLCCGDHGYRCTECDATFTVC